MSRAAMQALPGTALGLVRKYIDKSGKKRMVGVPERLKSSQPLVFILDIKTLILSKLSKKMEEHFNKKRTIEVIHTSFWAIHGWVGHHKAAGGVPAMFDRRS